MNVKQLLEVVDREFGGEVLEHISVYTTNDVGNIVPVSSVKSIKQRDAEGDTLVLVLERGE